MSLHTFKTTMTSKPQSLVWKFTPTEFRKVIKDSSNWSEAANTLYGRQANTRVVKMRAMQENLSTEHFRGRGQIKTKVKPRYSLDKLLKNDPEHKIPNQRLKEKLLKYHKLQDQCYTCGLHNRWNKRHLTLHLMHLNGNSFDNRLENLLIQCPNCRSQLSRSSTNVIILETCELCDIAVPSGETKCEYCNRMSPKRPSKHTLEKELNILDFEGVQRRYNVTKETLEHWLR